ncbi:hypothetical protein J6590_041930 [Homalodisca vitripennis]|nr:hypothetical protein J6590_041930 [Homalodisca vitripennis]
MNLLCGLYDRLSQGPAPPVKVPRIIVSLGYRGHRNLTTVKVLGLSETTPGYPAKYLIIRDASAKLSCAREDELRDMAVGTVCWNVLLVAVSVRRWTADIAWRVVWWTCLLSTCKLGRPHACPWCRRDDFINMRLSGGSPTITTRVLPDVLVDGWTVRLSTPELHLTVEFHLITPMNLSRDLDDSISLPICIAPLAEGSSPDY